MSPAHAAPAATTSTRPAPQPTPTAAPALLRSGRAPVAAPAVAPVAVVLAVLLVAAGAVGIRDALVAAGALQGSSWTAAAASSLDGLGPQAWMVPVGVALALVGLALLVLAVKPRRRTEVELSSEVDVWMRPDDLARIASYAAEDVSGVVRARTTATRRKVVVTVETTASDTQPVRTAVAAEVTARLEQVRSAPTVSVRARSTADAR